MPCLVCAVMAIYQKMTSYSKDEVYKLASTFTELLSMSKAYNYYFFYQFLMLIIFFTDIFFYYYKLSTLLLANWHLIYTAFSEIEYIHFQDELTV